jgi:hypothetical protein
MEILEAVDYGINEVAILGNNLHRKLCAELHI